MKKLLLASLLAAGSALPAQAATITFTQGSYALPSYTTATVFQSFETAPIGQYTPGANESVSGEVEVRRGTVPGEFVDPDTNPNNQYLAVQNGTYGVNFGAPVQFFSFILGSLDAYNQLVLNYADGTSQTLLGRQIIGDTGVGPFNSSTAGRVSYDFGGGTGLSSVSFTSGQPAFEIDALATAVPEASTWAMMLVGLGAVGGMARRRRRVRVSYAA